MNKVKPFFRVEIGVSKKSAYISGRREKFFFHIPKTNLILGKVIKFQVNTINLAKVITPFILGGIIYSLGRVRVKGKIVRDSSVKDSFNFAKKIATYDSLLYRASLNVESLFTNIPLN